MNIYQRMSAVTEELQTVAKNLMVETGKGKGYRAVSERDIIDAVKPLECKHGIYSYPAAREIVDSSMLESESEYGGKITKKSTFFSRIKTVYRFVNVDEPADFIETTTFAEGIDTQDKGSGKAMTYADKYALMKAYKISTGDDPDQAASEDRAYSAPERKAGRELRDRVLAGMNYIGMSDGEERRDFLKTVAGRSRLEDLTEDEATAVLNKLRRLAKNEADGGEL